MKENNFAKKTLFKFLKENQLLGIALISLYGEPFKSVESNVKTINRCSNLANQAVNSAQFKERMKDMLGQTHRPKITLQDSLSTIPNELKYYQYDYIYLIYRKWITYIDNNYLELYKERSTPTSLSKEFKNNSPHQ